MKVQFNFEKKHFYLILAIFVIFAGIIYVRGLANSVPPTPWHPLQEVAISSAGTTSVDADNNNVIDNSDLLNGKSSTYFEGLIQNTNALSIQGQTVYWTGLPSNPELCIDTQGACGTTNVACTTTSGTTLYDSGKIVPVACINANCNTACLTTKRCDGNRYAQCSLSTDKVYFQSGTCAAAQCSGEGECSCTCSATTQPTYVRETYTSPQTRCTSFIP